MRYHGERYSVFAGPRFSLNGARMGLAWSEGEWFKKPKEWKVNELILDEEWLRVFEGKRGAGSGSGVVVTDGAYLEEVS